MFNHLFLFKVFILGNFIPIYDTSDHIHSSNLLFSPPIPPYQLPHSSFHVPNTLSTLFVSVLLLILPSWI